MTTPDEPSGPSDSHRDESDFGHRCGDHREARHRFREERQAWRNVWREERRRRREEWRERMGSHRKGRVLHTRISEQLADEIRRLARDLRVPTSNLVRNVLEEVFSVVEDVSDDVGEILEQVADEARDARDRLDRRRAARSERAQRREAPPRQSPDEDIERELRGDEAAETGAGTPPSFDDVLGWQPLVLNRPGACARCGNAIARGERAFVGLGEQGPTRVTLCAACTEAV